MAITEVYVEDYGAAETNTGAQNALAFSAAIAALPPTGGTLRFRGRYVVDEIEFPNDPKVVDLIGSGLNASELVMGTPTGPLIKKTATTGRITGAKMAHFGVRAHANSDKTNLTHIALALSGWGASRFENISYKSAVAGGTPCGSVGIFIEQDASAMPTYNNVFSNIVAVYNYGPSRILYTNNGGTGASGNPNNLTLKDGWFYANNGIDVIFDGHNCTGATVENNLFESCSGTTAITLGQDTRIVRNWFESIGSSIVSNAAASLDGSGAVVMSNYFSGAGSIYLEPMARVPLWIGNQGGGQTFTGPVKPALIQAPGANPAAPTVTAATGTLALIGTSVGVSGDVTGRVTFHLRYAYTPTAVGATTITLAAPAGYSIEQSQVGATRNANGKPAQQAIQANASGGVFGIWFEAADQHEVDFRVTLARA